MGKARKPRKSRRGRQGKALPPERVATILSVAAKDGVQAAVDQFNVAERTIRRYKAKVESGKWPEVADLVTAFRKESVERCQDLLTEAYEVSLRRIIAQMPNATMEQAIKAGEMCGQLKVTRDVLGNEPGGADKQGSGTKEA